jgi:hypothetical protein
MVISGPFSRGLGLVLASLWFNLTAAYGENFLQNNIV